MIQLNDFKRMWQECSADVLDAVARVGASGWYILGEEVSLFEKQLAERVGGQNVVGCASGLDAIELALRAMELPRGARVLTTPLSAFATTLAIIRAGGTPCFVDVDDTGAIDLEAADLFFAANRDCRWFIPVHLYGHPLNCNALEALKRKYALFIVEDCAQSIGADYERIPVGGVAQCSAFSFYPTKNLGAIGDGGAVATADSKLAARLRALRDYGQSAKYVHSELGLNSRLDELQAAIMRQAFLPRLDRWTARRRAIAQRYCEAFAASGIKHAAPSHGAQSVWHLFPLLTGGPAKRDALAAHLKQRGIMSGVHYPVIIPKQRALLSIGIDAIPALPSAQRFADCELSIPIHPYLSDDEVGEVISAVEDWSRS